MRYLSAQICDFDALMRFASRVLCNRGQIYCSPSAALVELIVRWANNGAPCVKQSCGSGRVVNAALDDSLYYTVVRRAKECGTTEAELLNGIVASYK